MMNTCAVRGIDYLDKIKYVINFDGAGHKLGSDSLACIACSSEFSSQVGQMLAKSSSLIPSEPWPESNHSTFTFRGVPGLAYTSHATRKFAHQLDDSIRWVDEVKMKQVIELTTQIVEITHAYPIQWFRNQETAE